MALLFSVAPVEAEKAPSPLTFTCGPDNDLYSAFDAGGRRVLRFDDAAAAVEGAPPGSAVLILADGYPEKPTAIDPALLERARGKNLRLYVEYPSALPGLEVGAPRGAEWERLVVASDAFGADLPKLRILSAHDARFVPVGGVRDPWLVSARGAGFDTAVFGLPAKTTPVLFEIPERRLLVATTALSRCVSGRFAPAADWPVVWRRILARLDPDRPPPDLHWAPIVRPAYGPSGALPADAENHAFEAGVAWYRKSRLLVSATRRPMIERLLREGAESAPLPPEAENVGDGSAGILEGYASGILPDGSQLQRLPLRSDCIAEAAMALAIEGGPENRKVAANLLDYVYTTSGMCGGVRADPAHPAFGHIGWGAVAPAWLVANYGDDNARAILGTSVAAAGLKETRWNKALLRALLANLRTTGTHGFRGDRIDLPALEQRGWKAFHDSESVNLSPHFEAYLWACYLWAHRRTDHAEFLEKAKLGIRRMMEAYPGGWRWNNTLDEAHMLLPLAWLVRVEDTPEHRDWLRRVAGALVRVQDPATGAILERIPAGPASHLQVPATNEAYGTTESPLIHRDGDTASDQLYTTNFALLGLREAAAATGDPDLRAAEDRLAGYLVRIQARSERHPWIDGAWLRAFDYRRWDYWAASSDIGWGAWCAETGWSQAWIAAVLGMRLQKTTLWDWIGGVDLKACEVEVRAEMERNSGGPWDQK